MNIKEALETHFSVEELKDLSYEMGINYERFPQTQRSFALELIRYCERRNLLQSLLEMVVKKRAFLENKIILPRQYRKPKQSSSSGNAQPSQKRLPAILRGKWKIILLSVLFGTVGIMLLIFMIPILDINGVLAEPPAQSTPDTSLLVNSPTLQSQTKIPTSIALSPEPEPPIIEEATSTLTLIPTNTPEINTPTETYTSEPVATVADTPTPTVQPLAGSKLIVVIPKYEAINIYTQDSDVNGLPRGQVIQNDILEILDKNDAGDWYQISVVKNGVEGWIVNDPNIVVPFEGQIPTVVQEPTQESSSASSSSCVHVTITRIVKSNDLFDDVILNWSNIPTDAFQAQVTVRGTNGDGVSAMVVQPTFNDLKSPYTVQEWKFIAGNFQFDSTYSYTVKVLDSGNNQICEVRGTFNQ